MLKIKKITIENFRGIKLPLSLDFIKDTKHTSVLLYGRNGTGKSSIVDAWEWFNTFEIAGLKREGVSTQDYPHKSSEGKDSYVLIDLHHDTIGSIKAEFNSKKSSEPKISGEYTQFRTYCTYPNYLRYADLQDFVFKTKTEKYKYIAKFFGLETFTKNQDDLQTAISKIESNLISHQTHLDNNITQINQITKSSLSTIDNQAIISFANNIALRHNIPKIDTIEEVNSIKINLEKIIQTSPTTKELTEWKAFQIKQNQFYPIKTIKKDIENLEKIFSDLKKDEESIKQLILSDLYKLSMELVPQLEDQTICPICDTRFEGTLLNHITLKHEKLATLNKNKIDFETQKSALEMRLTNIHKKISTIQSESSEMILEAFKTFFDELNTIDMALPNMISLLKNQLKDISIIEIHKEPSIEKIENIINNEEKNKLIVSDRIVALEKDGTSKILAQDFKDIADIIDNYTNYLINIEKVNYLGSILKNLTNLFIELTTFIQSKINDIFASISKDVVKYYNKIESSNAFMKNPEIKLITDKNKAVELSIEFNEEKIVPAFKFLSESQVNSFGLSIFLASVKHFNNKFNFFILDDVINSFDASKRSKVSHLLASDFSDFQVLLLTHDQIFFDTLQKDFPNWQRYKFTGWDFATGPKTRLAKNYTEEIQDYLDEDKPIGAGQTLGRYLEWTFGMLNERLKTPIPYKVENIYTLSEYHEPLVRRFKDKLKTTHNKQHKLIQAFEEFEQGTIFRNYCVHWKNEANQFTTPEIDTVFKKWIEIEKMIYCDKCKSLVKLDKPSETEYIKCDCGILDLKASAYY